VDNSVVKFSIEKSRVHNYCIKSEHLVKKKTFSGEQKSDNKCYTKSVSSPHWKVM